MKKIIFILSAALFAILGIVSIDKYNEALKNETGASVAMESTTASKGTSKPDDGTDSQVIDPETTEDPSDNSSLTKVKYKDASLVLGTNFSDNLTAKSAILIDVNSKSIVYRKNAEQRLSPASTTKLITALTALEYLKLDDVITVQEEIYLVGAGSSTAELAVGDKLTVEQLIQGLLISSGNDSAYTLAVNAARKAGGESMGRSMSVEKFVELMNKNVKKLGLKNTHFTSPDGYDSENQYTTAKDLSVIAYAAYQNETIRSICRLPSIYVPEKGVTWTNTNELINPDSQYYFDKALGMKTGSTGDAGKCLVSVAADGDKEYISVVLDSDEEGRWKDSLGLLKYGLSLE